MEARYEFRLLGPIEARADARPLALGGPKQRAVLALLLLHANEVVMAERLIDELWAETPPPTARETIKVYVGRLRKLFPAGGPRPADRQPLELRAGVRPRADRPEEVRRSCRRRGTRGRVG